MNKKTPLIAAFFIIALATLWHIYMPSPHQSHTIEALKEDIPDSYMTQVTLTQYDQTGQLTQQLQAHKITHLELENTYHYDHPQISWFDQQHKAWQLTAVYGISKDGKDNIDLWQDVLLQHQKPDTQVDTRATTSKLSANSVSQTLHTNQPVRIEHPGVVITGEGLHGDMKTGEVKTLAHTETTITPQRTSNSGESLDIRS